ncbi:MAG: DUF4358 domain-containing protein [Ruminiclostridium sp.]|nr:DUF4358 domain-containing protein [Ruminiclostridium sp.]
MKKLLALVLALCIVLCTSCNDNITSSVDSSDNSTSVTESAQNSSETTEDDNVSLDELCDVVLNSTEFPAMSKTEMTEMLDMIMDFSEYGIEEYAVYQQAMSVHLCEVIVIRTSDVKATIEALEQRKDVLINQLAFYPEQQEAAKNTVVGSKNDICYLITHKDAKTAEKALLQKI